MSDEITDDKSDVFFRPRSSVSRSPSKDKDNSVEADVQSTSSTVPDLDKGSRRSTPSKSRKRHKISDEDPSDSDETSSFRTTSVRSYRRKSPKEINRCREVRSCCSCILYVFKIMFVTAGLVLLALLLVGFFLAKLEFHCKLDELSPSLYSSIYGQDVAIKTTLDAVKDFCASASHEQPLTLVFWGPTGVGKTTFASIFTHHFDSNGQVVPAEHFRAAKYKDWYGSRFHNKPFVYTVDDVMSVKEMEDIAANTEMFAFPLVLVLTTSMESNLLNESFIEWCVKGGDEGDFVYRGKNPQWLDELKHLNPIVVPFLPLSRTNVKLCIEKTLNRLKMNYVKDDVEKIANEFQYFHNDKRLFSTIGCKRVNDKIFSVLSLS